MSIDTPLRAIKEQLPNWNMTADLMEGSGRMRDQHSEYLPKYEHETDANYKLRWSMAVLHNAFRKTVRSLTNKPFKKGIVIENFPKDWESWLSNIDRDGTHHDIFVKKLLIDIMTYGLCHYMVDFPSTDRKLTKAEEKQFDIRPYFSRICPLNILGWRFDENILTELRIKSFRIEIDKNYVEQEIEQVIVWTPTAIITYEKNLLTENKKEEWTAVRAVENTLGKIPLVTVYADKKSPMVADSPLEDLAFTNVRHFQSSADQQYILRIARVPFLEFCGYDESEVTAIISVSNAFANSNTQSTVRWVEITGESMKAGQDDLDKLEDRMMSMGAEMLVKARPGHISATEKAIEEEDRISDLQSFVRNLEHGLEQGYSLMGEWVKKTVTLTVSIFQGFGLSLREKDEVDMLLRARVAGEISRESYLGELRRRNIVEGLDIESEIARLNKENLLDFNA